ncbi:restriction endonuclease subunit S [Neisseria sp. HMSC31F04]|uniref:restriction endonuclease subunit S n=1 Tax=Neisseria sp. HMSC31F04 TaxID=1581075 RepID=UPI0008A5F1F6|nr:restriction endonuclease subunit S [Neisseria sp. HMSC31F04]
MTAEQQLPEGWKKTTLGEISIVKMGQSPNGKSYNKEKEGYLLIGGASDLGDIYPSPKQYTNEATKLSKANDIIICIRATIGRLNLSDKVYCLGRGVAGIEVNENIETKFIWYSLMNNEAYLLKNSTGTTFQQISSPTLKKLPIIYPTSKETQQAIVNKIESLLDEIDEGIGRLKTAAQQIQQYRQSLLKNAFNGELTKEWRSKHADTLPSENELLAQIQTTREQHYAQQLVDWQTAVSQWEQNGKVGKKPSKPKAPTQAVKFEDNFADLPSGWGAIKINQVAEIFTGATPLKSNANYYENGSIPWVTSGSLNNEFVDSADSFVTDLALKETNLKLLPKHTLLVAMYGEGKTRGKCSELLIEATTNQAIAGIVLNEKYPISRKFLKFYMFKNYADIRRQSSGGVQPNLNLSLVGNIIFPLPCLAEQTQIVAILESKLTACDQLAAELAKQLKQAELLKQAVLKAAFSGNLLDK